MKLRYSLQGQSLLFLIISTLALPQQEKPEVEEQNKLKDEQEDKKDLKKLAQVSITTAKKQISLSAIVSYHSGPGQRPEVILPCRCGVRNTTGDFLSSDKLGRIYNGEKARVNEFPWRVSINPVGNPTKSLCGGALISNEWVLTSASCLYHKSIEHILIDLGDHNLAETSETDHILVPVSQKILHEDYVPQSKNILSFPSNPLEDYDIALVKLSEPTKGKNVHPVCLPRHLIDRDLTGSQVVTSGWGIQANPQQQARNELHRVSLTYYSSDQYRKTLGPSHFPELKTPDLDNLVYTFDNDKGIYPLDHGTTMEYLDVGNGLYYAVGVASAIQYKNDKKQFLGAWTDVKKFLKWIDKHSGGAQFCNP